MKLLFNWTISFRERSSHTDHSRTIVLLHWRHCIHVRWIRVNYWIFWKWIKPIVNSVLDSFSYYFQELTLLCSVVAAPGVRIAYFPNYPLEISTPIAAWNWLIDVLSSVIVFTKGISHIFAVIFVDFISICIRIRQFFTVVLVNVLNSVTNSMFHAN